MGVLGDDPAWGELAEAFPKLVLHGNPCGISNVVELERRMALWGAGDLAGLLARVETQAAASGRSTTARTVGQAKAAAASRARRLAREGALSKAVGGLKGGIKTLEEPQ